MKTINLPADTRHLFLDEIAHLIADYNEPEGPNDPDGVKYELGKIQATNEAHQAAINGQLRVRHPRGGPFQLELGLQRAVVQLPDVVAYLAEYGIAAVIDTAPAQEATTHAPVVVVNDGPAQLKTIIHSTKVRRDYLTPVIELAQKQCTNPRDTAAVWAALLVLAEKKEAPLIGATEDGLQYYKGGEAAIFTRKALGQRLAR